MEPIIQRPSLRSTPLVLGTKNGHMTQFILRQKLKRDRRLYYLRKMREFHKAHYQDLKQLATTSLRDVIP